MNTSPILRHLVLRAFTDATSELEREQIAKDFAGLKLHIDLIRYFECGLNNSSEGLGQGFTHCFNLGFDSAAARDAYLAHPAHLAFVERFKPWLAKVLVLDYWAISA